MLCFLALAAPKTVMATAVDVVPVNESSRAPLEICDTSVPPISGAGVTSIFEPNSPPAREIRNLSYLVFGICIAIFVVVQGFLVVAIVRGVKAARAAARDPVLAAREPVQVYGSVPIEVAWTVVPVIIVFVLTMVTIRTIRDIDTKQPPAGALEIGVIGHQWWWEFRYQAADGSTIVTANELHVPVGRAVALRLNSADVIHSFWVPRLAGKMDLIPGHTNMMWFVAEKPGLYLGQCAEYCGAQHAHMLLRVNADETPAFDQWLAAQAAPAVEIPAIENPAVAQGRAVFSQYACLNCHAITGTSDGLFGPNLTHLASRATIGSGAIPLTRANLRQWIDDPNSLKPACNMPSLKLTNIELDAVTDYLMTLQ
ncbi:MAG: cytochrome c oxidase subunit II [Planctomycetota bacterium]